MFLPVRGRKECVKWAYISGYGAAGIAGKRPKTGGCLVFVRG